MRIFTIISALLALVTTSLVFAAPLVTDTTITVRDPGPNPCEGKKWHVTCDGLVASANQTITAIQGLCNEDYVKSCEPGTHVPDTKDSVYVYRDRKASIRLGEQCGVGDKWDAGYCFRAFSVINAACGHGMPGMWFAGTGVSECDGTRIKVEYSFVNKTLQAGSRH